MNICNLMINDNLASKKNRHYFRTSPCTRFKSYRDQCPTSRAYRVTDHTLGWIVEPWSVEHVWKKFQSEVCHSGVWYWLLRVEVGENGGDGKGIEWGGWRRELLTVDDLPWDDHGTSFLKVSGYFQLLILIVLNISTYYPILFY